MPGRVILITDSCGAGGSLQTWHRPRIVIGLVMHLHHFIGFSYLPIIPAFDQNVAPPMCGVVLGLARFVVVARGPDREVAVGGFEPPTCGL